MGDQKGFIDSKTAICLDLKIRSDLIARACLQGLDRLDEKGGRMCAGNPAREL